MEPRIQYAQTADGVSIAYEVLGKGPGDLVFVPGIVSHVEFFHELPGYTGFLRRLAAFARVIVFDKRGNGLSDRIVGAPTLEERMDDIRAVMEAVGSERAALMGVSEGGPLSLVFAATYPERVDAVVLYETFAFVAPRDPARDLAAAMVQLWGTGASLRIMSRTRGDDTHLKALWARAERLSISPALRVARRDRRPGCIAERAGPVPRDPRHAGVRRAEPVPRRASHRRAPHLCGRRGSLPVVRGHRRGRVRGAGVPHGRSTGARARPRAGDRPIHRHRRLY